MATTGETPTEGEVLEWAMAQTRVDHGIPRLPTHRAITCWLIDRGLSHDDIDALPVEVKQDYLRLWELGIVGPLAERRGAFLQLLAAGLARSGERRLIGDVFPELRHIYEGV